MNTSKIIAKLYECSQKLAIEAFMSNSQKRAAELYDNSHPLDMVVLSLKGLQAEEDSRPKAS